MPIKPTHSAADDTLYYAIAYTTYDTHTATYRATYVATYRATYDATYVATDDFHRE